MDSDLCTIIARQNFIRNISMNCKQDIISLVVMKVQITIRSWAKTSLAIFVVDAASPGTNDVREVRPSRNRQVSAHAGSPLPRVGTGFNIERNAREQDASAEFFSVLTSTLNSALYKGHANIQYMYGGASDVDTNADAMLTISSTAINAFLHQIALFPIFGMIAAQQIVMCQVFQGCAWSL